MTTCGGKRRIVVVDDHPLLRGGLVQAIRDHEGLDVCGEAEDTVTALKVIAATRPDAATVDISFTRGRNGIELIKDLKIRHPQLPILVVSMHEESLYAERALRAGARGYITKEEAPTRIIQALQQVLAGEYYVSPRMSTALVRRVLEGSERPVAATPLEALTDRELEVYGLLGKGLGVREIGQALQLSVKTIETHREHIKKKLGLARSSDLVRHAIRWAQSVGQAGEPGGQGVLEGLGSPDPDEA